MIDGLIETLTGKMIYDYEISTFMQKNRNPEISICRQ